MTAAILFLNRARQEKLKKEKVEQQQKRMNRIEGRNVLVYRGVPYVRYNAR